MLGFLFGFNARLGRLSYFLATIALAVVMTGISFAIASTLYHLDPRVVASSDELVKTWPVIAAMIGFGWATFSLQAMRIRDIGWDPVCVIPAWIAIVIVDAVVAGKFSAWSLGAEHEGTPVGALINFGLFVALTFWPSGGQESPTFGAPPNTLVKAASRTASAIPAQRIARVTGAESGHRRY
jgi:uncharacterized membrane protein YhaH (DUF805 family)